ncbi:MAG: CHAT domain-containing protein, partial [Bacteroidota bacterium]
IKNSEAQTFAGISEDLLEQEREQKVQIAFYERLLNEAENEEEQTKYQRELFDLRQNYQAFLEDLEQSHPAYYELKYELEYPSISELRTNLLDNQTAMLEYFTGDSSIYLFVLTQQDLQVQQLEKTTAFEGNLEQLRENLNQISNNSFADFTSSSYFVYNHFLQGALDDLPSQINQLLLIPDGQFSYIPFQALIRHPVDQATISDPRFDTLSYLVQDYSISYTYSSTLLLQHRGNKKAGELSFGGFAPVFLGGSNIPERSELGELPYSQMEVENIYSLIGGKSYFQADASLANFKEQAANFNILHLSTHAAVNDEKPAQSRIYFHDDYLTINEIYNLPINANFTVLSACETGVGDYRRGEGMLSLARAFMYAGCPSLMTSLWQVNDEKTADLMQDFYDQLLQKKPKDQALQQAQINYLKTASMEAAHPFYWAAFVQVGDKEAIINGGLSWIWYLTLLGIGLLLLGVYWKRKTS